MIGFIQLYLLCAFVFALLGSFFKVLGMATVTWFFIWSWWLIPFVIVFICAPSLGMRK